MADKRVAAMVVTYNRLPLLQKCIASLRGQTADCDVLVVDMESQHWLRKSGSFVLRKIGGRVR